MTRESLILLLKSYKENKAKLIKRKRKYIEKERKVRRNNIISYEL